MGEIAEGKVEELTLGKEGFSGQLPCPNCGTRLDLCIYTKAEPTFCSLTDIDATPVESTTECELVLSDKGFNCRVSCPNCGHELNFVVFDSEEYLHFAVLDISEEQSLIFTR